MMDAAAVVWGTKEEEAAPVHSAHTNVLELLVNEKCHKRAEEAEKWRREVGGIEDRWDERKWMDSNLLDFGVGRLLHTLQTQVQPVAVSEAQLVPPHLEGVQATVLSAFFTQYVPGWPKSKSSTRSDPGTAAGPEVEDPDCRFVGVEKDTQTVGARLRRLVLDAFRSQHGGDLAVKHYTSSYGCTALSGTGDECMGPVLYSSPTSALLFPTNWEGWHWVAVAVHQLGDIRLSSGSCTSIIVMDHYYKVAGGDKKSDEVPAPNWHAELIEKFRNILYLLFNDCRVCDPCKAAFEAGRNIGPKLDVIPGVSPLVPRQFDTIQCGAMTILAIQAFVQMSSFRECCLMGTRQMSSPALTFYRHADSVRLRKYLRDERDEILSRTT